MNQNIFTLGLRYRTALDNVLASGKRLKALDGDTTYAEYEAMRSVFKADDRAADDAHKTLAAACYMASRGGEGEFSWQGIVGQQRVTVTWVGWLGLPDAIVEDMDAEIVGVVDVMEGVA